jgi:hypothetical protein
MLVRRRKRDFEIIIAVGRGGSDLSREFAPITIAAALYAFDAVGIPAEVLDVGDKLRLAIVASVGTIGFH